MRVHEKSSLYGGHKGGNCEYIGDLRGAWQKRVGGGVFQWGGGGGWYPNAHCEPPPPPPPPPWYPNAHCELGNNFNCDFNVPMPLFSPLISNKKKYYLAIDWPQLTFDAVRR